MNSFFYMLLICRQYNIKLKYSFSNTKINGCFLWSRNQVDLFLKYNFKKWILNKIGYYKFFPQRMKMNIVETITFAHELGHALSFNKGFTLGKEIDSANMLFKFGFELSQERKKFILKEELKAWRIAKILLKKTEFKDWTEFENLKSQSLNSYEKALKITV